RATGHGESGDDQGSRAVRPARRAQTPVGVLRSPATIRERCRNILDAAIAGRSANFRVDRSRLDAAALRVEAVTRRRYRELRIPYHSRWRHFEVGDIDRKA